MYISEEQVPNLIRAVEHYAAYLKATKRDDRPYCELAESFKRKPKLPVPQRQLRASKQRWARRSQTLCRGCAFG